ncbi:MULTISPECIES: potassium-transporting ATPase subunit KdpC [unclassified Thermoanaerobacterium]|uniref:potassium-transporting ATPase subunit KdpC n=1 Tax=unclassified Thermoanaerobacterium TaxID=2622527 RepID=UPI000A15B289|nr:MULTISPECIES: potassium-transporting ATPase subunit KdpC [unclassified Thermoanaerobacterium]MDE4542235.1 potassium-transporting ATPase subunit KdpC [Thermoanaerobacterium sp. R66]ORX22237.1 potassium-transporting ATPase subunit C [Thermoanaerobacterium sp. PSU-2]
MIKNAILKSIMLLIVFSVFTGLLYPLAISGIAQLIFPHQANGSLIYKDGQVIGSSLIGQQFSDPKYFHGRPSSAGETGYDATSSSASNLGPTNKLLIEKVKKLAQQVRKENGLKSNTAVPSDLITSSASGLDPDISIDAALIQIPRIAKARNISEEKLKNLVNEHIVGRQLGILGEPRVNVLELNIALDNLK